MKILLPFIFSLSLAFASPVADEAIPVLSPGEIKRVVGNYPARNSEVESLEDQVILRWQETRTEEQCQKAALQKNATLRNLFGPPYGPLSEEEIQKLNSLSHLKLWKVAPIVGANITIAKTIYRRPRPYNRNRAIVPCISKEASWAYPSGHATIARLYARVLGRIYPARRKVFLQHADQAALNRVIGGVHHPSDIEAGNKLGDELYLSFY